MSRTTGIEWTEHTWNPFVGCNVHTAGCTNCYAMRQAHRIEQFGTVSHYKGLTKKVNGNIVWTGKVARASDAGMSKPLKIPGSALIFVNSMSDFWHPAAKDDWRLAAIDVIRRTPQHQYQVLTKRPEEAAAFFRRHPGVRLPNNFWLGATVEDSRVKHRIDTIRAIPAKVRFLSIEPLIGPVGPLNLRAIHWVITGGESGPGARPCHAGWVRDIRDQCAVAGVALFHKQWGHWRNNPLALTAPAGRSPADWVAEQDPDGKGGSLVDGRHWKDWPAAYAPTRTSPV